MLLKLKDVSVFVVNISCLRKFILSWSKLDPLSNSQCTLQHMGKGSSLDQGRIDVCKQEIIITKTDSSLNCSYKFYYHFIYNNVLYLMYILLTKICNINITTDLSLL
jgi:hypothetical protein